MLTVNPAEGNMPQKQSAIDGEQDGLHKAPARKPALDGDERSPTMRLEDRRFSNITIESWMPRERVSQLYSTYRAVPAALVQNKEFARQRRWRIELRGNEPVTDPTIRLDVVGDTTLGRGSSADVDLRAFDADNLGVSRQHALLRPTPNHLYLIDLSSTNGTLHNATPVTSGVARPLENNDVITLGKLIFTVHVLGLVEVDEEEEPADVGHIELPASQHSEEVPSEERSKHPASPTIHIPRPTQLQETLLPDHVQRALK